MIIKKSNTIAQSFLAIAILSVAASNVSADATTNVASIAQFASNVYSVGGNNIYVGDFKYDLSVKSDHGDDEKNESEEISKEFSNDFVYKDDYFYENKSNVMIRVYSW